MTAEVAHYFAFGANMARRVLVERRGLVPLASEPAVLEDYALRFVQRGVPGLEPCFASVVECRGSVVHGVLHTMHLPDLARLDRLEASYERVPVRVRTARGTVEATTYRARRPLRTEGRPSSRYLGLLVEGALEHGIPDAWVETLRARRGHHVPLLSPVVEIVLEGAERTLRRLRRPRGR